MTEVAMYRDHSKGEPMDCSAVTAAQRNDDLGEVEGVIVIPALPVCRIRLRTDMDRLYRYGPGRKALLAYVRAALHEDIVRELPLN